MRSRTWTCLTVVVALSAAAFGVTPGQWRHATEGDFASGELSGVMATSRGELRLAPRVDVVLSAEAAPVVVAALAAGPDGVWIGDGTEPRVHRINEDGEAELAAELPGAMIGTLRLQDGELLAGTCGDGAGIYRLRGEGEFEPVWVDPDVEFVWAIEPDGDGGLYAATGPEGKVFAIDAEGEGKVVYEAGDLADNILCLATADDGRLLAGTDKNGLVLKIDPERAKGRVILDADETEIAALVPARGGGVYAATSDAAKAVPSEGGPMGPGEGPLEEGGPMPPEEELGWSAPAGEAEAAHGEAMVEAPADGAPDASEAGGGPDSSDLMPLRDGATLEDSDPISEDGEPLASEDPPDPEEPPVPDEDGEDDEDGDDGEADGEEPKDEPGGEALDPPERVVRGGAPGGEGNAVYFIHPDGLVETIFRRPLIIMSMVRLDGRLLLGTGDEGKIFTVTTGGDEVAMLADVEPSQVTALAAGPDGAAHFATANRGSVALLSAEPAEEGTFTSPAMDAGQVARWGTLHTVHEAPGRARVTVSTRSGNTAEPDDAAWSDWVEVRPAGPGFGQIASPTARFLQYRLELTAGRDDGPVVRGVEAMYQVGNLPPAIASVGVSASAGGDGGGPGPNGMPFRAVAINATDPNGDGLEYTVHFRRVGTETWIEVADELAQAQYLWDSRTVPDGEYEFRVTASDAPSNPPAEALQSARISSRTLVDNTRPNVPKLAAEADRDGNVTVTGVAKDAASRLVAMAYSVDSADEWVPLLPSDRICDAPTEAFRFELTALEPGPHRIAVKVTDQYGNTAYASVEVKTGD